MENRVEKQLEILVNRYPELSTVKKEISEAYQILESCYTKRGKLLIAGNGGSAADAEHIVGELMKGFKLPRKSDVEFAEKLVAENKELGSVLAESLQGALPAIALDGHPALSTAYMNDCEPLLCFAQQVNGYGKAEDVFLGILAPLMPTLTINWAHWNTVLFALKTSCWTSPIFRGTLLSTTLTGRHHGLASLSISGSSSAKMRTVMTSPGPSSAVSILLSGSPETSRIIL